MHPCSPKFAGDILDAPYPQSRFDVITCFHVFEHLYRPLEVMRRVEQWLKPDGCFVLMVPNVDSAGTRIFRSYWHALELPRRLFHFSPKSLLNLAESVGLEQIAIEKGRELFIEKSMYYILNDCFEKIGVKRRPLSESSQPVLPIRAARKLYRLGLEPILNEALGMAGDRESFCIVFKKGRGTS